MIIKSENLNRVLLVFCICHVMLSLGCSYRPIVSGPGYVGIGVYRDLHQPGEGLPEHIDIKGVGTLFSSDRIIIGYCELNAVYRDETSMHTEIKLSKSEIAMGKVAETKALEMAIKANKKQPLKQ